MRSSWAAGPARPLRRRTKWRRVRSATAMCRNLNASVFAVIASGQGTLLDLVEALGPALTNTDGGRRIQGMALLGRVLGAFRSYALPASSVQLLVGFYLERLEDAVCVSELLEGVVALVQLQELEPHQALSLCAGVLGLSMHAFGHNVRALAYGAVVALLDRHEPSARLFGFCCVVC